MRNVAEIGKVLHTVSDTYHLLPISTGLNILFTLLQKFSVSAQVSGEFFKVYFLELMEHVFAVVTDTSHTASKQNRY